MKSGDFMQVKSNENDVRILTLDDLKKMETETPVYIETKQSVRPAFFIGLIDRALYVGDSEFRYAVHLMTMQKLTKRWQFRLYNKTWRLWSGKPTREQIVEVKWE